MADDTAMHVHVLRVRDHRIRCADPVMVAGCVGHDAIALDLDAEWEGLSVRVVIGEGEGAVEADWEGEPMVLPDEPLAEPGWLPVTVVGESDGSRIVTEAAPHAFRVVEGGYVKEAS